MLNSFLESIKEHFSKRFIFSSLLPVLVFGWLSILLYEILSRQPTLFQYFSTKSIDWQIICGSLLLGCLISLAYFLDTFFVNLLRIYEGYWNNTPVLNWIEKKRKISFQFKWDKLVSRIEELRREIQSAEKNQNKKQAGKMLTSDFYTKLGNLEREWFSHFPPNRELVMPTFLGNLIRSAELYPLYRYNIDAVIMWTRLQSLLPEPFLSGFQNVWSSMRLALNLNVLAVVFTLTWSIYSLIAYQQWLAAILIIIIGWVICSLSFQILVRSTKSYCDLIRVSFDLYRWKLLEALNIEPPKTYAEERELWGNITDLLYRNVPPNDDIYHYVTSSTNKNSK